MRRHFGLLSMNSSKKIGIPVFIIGDPDVGKTSIRFSFSQQEGSHFIMGFGADITFKDIVKDDQIYRFVIYKFVGKLTYNRTRSSVYSNIQAVIIVFDVTNEESFNNIENWYSNVHRYDNKKKNIIIIGNKIDMRNSKSNAISSGKAKNLVAKLKNTSSDDIFYFETSIHNSESINDVFMFLVDYFKKRNEAESNN